MPRVCTICVHPERSAIDGALVDGEPYRSIAKRHAVSPNAVLRHRRDHIPATLATAKEVAEIANADTLLDRLRMLNRETGEILKAAKSSGDHALALKAIARVERQIELEGRLLGELQEGASVVNVLVMPEFVAAQTTILRALAPFPAARVAVAEALAANGTGA